MLNSDEHEISILDKSHKFIVSAYQIKLFNSISLPLTSTNETLTLSQRQILDSSKLKCLKTTILDEIKMVKRS